MKKYIPILIIIALMITALFLGLHKYLTFDALKAGRLTLLDFVRAHPILAPTLYICIYALATALSIPGGIFLTLAGGFLFGVFYAIPYVIFGATLGATGIFLATRTAFGETLAKKAGPHLSKLRAGLRKNAASYMLFLRLVPLFPFWLVNISPALLSVPLRTYIWTTAVGILPGVYVYAQLGSGLSVIFDSGATFNLKNALNLQMQIALFCLALLSLLPVVIKKVRDRH